MKIPTLAIGSGMQVVNGVCGGTHATCSALTIEQAFGAETPPGFTSRTIQGRPKDVLVDAARKRHHRRTSRKKA